MAENKYDYPIDIRIIRYILRIVIKQYTTEDVMDDLRRRVSSSTQVAVAASLGVSAQHVNDLLNGRREMSERIAGAMGYERKIVFCKRAA